ncbi:sulfite exporter TauE/SafE family protein [Hydrogenophaga sp.]|uniref:sulfite exporter TauE/SafE family protein n=1 Tax=Hydrogenophaga sp. TaxID=1904254 RepID=UPI00271F8526|nr:sulfite exporter TauE/SafE family protein [Hydrogenophaga sp.]MDO8904070.1 sulfite exporter TauE/SafE family protein [Hydrogenophaga sp.]
MAFFDQYSVAWLIGLALALLATGLVAGTLAGLLGVGGGIVIVPVLYHLFTLLGIDESVRMHVAVGTSLATIIPTSIMSSRAHRKKGSLDMALIKRLMPSVVVGVIAGSIASRYLSGGVLTAVFATVALVVALNMAFKKEGFTVGNGLPGPAGTALLGGGIGGISTLMGIGGGTLSVPILNALRVPMHTAVGTGAMLGMVISFPGALAFLFNGLDVPLRPPLSIGYVNLLGMALIVPATMLTTGFGAKLAHSIDARRLRQVFAAFLALTSLRMFYGMI